MTPGATMRWLCLWLLASVAMSLWLSGCAALGGSAPPDVAAASAKWRDWTSLKLVDVRTGKAFSMGDFKGRVVLIETIAQWCPNCLFQQHQTRLLRKNVAKPDDLVLVSLDVDSQEDEASLKDYTDQFAFDWYFAVAPLELQRALSNLYSVEYLNPPLEPMLLLDRHGNAHTLPWGEKSAETLEQIVAPFLSP